MSATDALSAIFSEFARRRKQDKIGAWQFLQQALADNAGVLCPTAVSLKDLISAVANVEDMLKGATSDTNESPSEALMAWLNGETSSPVAKKGPVQ